LTSHGVVTSRSPGMRASTSNNSLLCGDLPLFPNRPAFPPYLRPRKLFASFFLDLPLKIPPQVPPTCPFVCFLFFPRPLFPLEETNPLFDRVLYDGDRLPSHFSPRMTAALRSLKVSTILFPQNLPIPSLFFFFLRYLEMTGVSLSPFPQNFERYVLNKPRSSLFF